MTLLGYRYALDPTPRQARYMAGHCAAARKAFNWGLGRVKANLDQRAAEATYGIPEEFLTPGLNWSLYSFRRDWNQVKNDVAPWWAEYSKESYSAGLDALARALKNWGDSRQGKHKGRVVGFPRFKSKRRTVPSCRFTTGTIRCEERYAVLPRIGRVKLHEHPTRLLDALGEGSARIMSATIRFERGRWFVSFTVEASLPELTPARPDAAIGVDLGIKTLATLSEGPPTPNPRHYAQAQRKLARLSRRVSRRRGPDRRIGQAASNAGSKRWQRANVQRNRVHHRVADQRRDAMHKLTTRLASTYGTIVVEDLNITGMLSNRKLARHIADAGFGEFRRQLEYKAERFGGRVIVADRWFPSSKTCSGCGTVKAKLLLSEREYVCESCGLIMGRDKNAARNLAALAVAASSAETQNGRGADQKTRATGQVAEKRQPGTAPAGQTQTPLPEGAGV
ncbi:IS607 family element RNA-guided endonuclease TnpB [Actinopolymorpha pittospori]